MVIPKKDYEDKIVRLEYLAQAIKAKGGNQMRERDAQKASEHIINFFGYNDRIIDNMLEPNDRDNFYSLENYGLLATEVEEVTLYDGRTWRIHYWKQKKSTIFAICNNLIAFSFDSIDEKIKERMVAIADNIKSGGDTLSFLQYQYCIEDIYNEDGWISCDEADRTKVSEFNQALKNLKSFEIITVDNSDKDDERYKLTKNYFKIVPSSISEFISNVDNIEYLHEKLIGSNFSVDLDELIELITTGSLGSEGSSKQAISRLKLKTEIQGLEEIIERKRNDYGSFMTNLNAQFIIPISDIHEETQNIQTQIALHTMYLNKDAKSRYMEMQEHIKKAYENSIHTFAISLIEGENHPQFVSEISTAYKSKLKNEIKRLNALISQYHSLEDEFDGSITRYNSAKEIGEELLSVLNIKDVSRDASEVVSTTN